MHTILRVTFSVFALIALAVSDTSAQSRSEVVSAGGSSGVRSGLIFNTTLGEAFVSTQSVNGEYLGQGFQATHPATLTTSVKIDSEVLTLKLFPNPFSHEVFLSGDIKPDRLDLFDLHGQCVSTIHRPSERIAEWADLPVGVYIIRGVYLDKSFNIGKLIKINP